MSSLWRILVLGIYPIKKVVFACSDCSKTGARTIAEAGMNASDGSYDIAATESFAGFFQRLFSADFMPHGHCYYWKPEIVWLHVISDALIALSYYAIPLVLLYFMFKRRDFPFPWVLGMFGAFILLCGTTHLMAIVTLWNPVYRLDGIVKAMTAGISVLTALVLIPLIPQALALRSPKELEAANEKLNDANEKLKEIDRLKDNFFSNVSHELRTPLTLILAPLESFLSGESGSLSATQKAQMEVMHNNSIRLFQMVNSILDFAKISAGKIEVKREPLEITSLTQSILREFQPIIKQKNLTMAFDSSPSEKFVNMDRYLYERILFNLLSNAAKFTKEKGSISVKLGFDGDKMILSVSDTGIGISESDQATLFHRFRQIDSSSTRRFEGTGLGLALVKEFSVLLDGNVSVESSLNKGSTFRVMISAPEAEAVPQGPTTLQGRFQKFEGASPEIISTPFEASETAGAKILIAEDNRELATYIASILREQGEVIRYARDGEEAISIAKEWLPDLVLSDVMMPKSDGFSVCAAIKQDPRTSSIPVILLTALTHRDALVRGWESGADEYLFKPFHPTELKIRIKSLLSLVHERKQRQQEIERRRELEQFSYFASHDLTEPTRVITTISELLQQRYLGKIGPEADELIGFIRDASIRMRDVINDLIAYSSLDANPPAFEQVQSEQAIQAAVSNLGVAIEESGAKITYENLPKVPADITQLTRLFQNLIGNAIKYRSQDKAPEIQVSARRAEGEWIFAVSDNGIGFEQQYAERIFVIFKRLHDPSKYQGTGVGLAICKRIVARHEGRIWAESELGKGATFFFTLPVRQRTASGRKA
jgi:signal transduction histidine kinase